MPSLSNPPKHQLVAAAVNAHLAEHHGVIARAEAREAGMSTSAIDRQVARGDWVRVGVGVYRAASHRNTWQSRARAAAVGLNAVVSHRSALALWSVEGFPSTIIEVTMPHTARRTAADVVIHRTKQPGLMEVNTIDGIPVTGIGRTVLDTAAVVGPRRLDWVVDAVIRQRLVDWMDLYDVLVRHSARGRDGCGKLRALLDNRYGESQIPDSKWNRMVFQLLIDSGLPAAKLEHEVRLAASVVRVDLAYPQEKLAIELDSVRWHLNRQSFERDARRKNGLLLAGWRVLTFTWDDYANSPADLVAVVAKSLRSGESEPR